LTGTVRADTFLVSLADLYGFYNMVKIKDLDKISIIGLGLLGGSLGLAVNRAFPHLRRIGYSHRSVTREKAREAGTVDEVYSSVAEAVCQSPMVVLASPIGTFEGLLAEMAEALPAGCLVTDVGSTKVLPTRWAQAKLPRHVEFLGSHPMAGSEQRGVDFARADLFDDAYCIITPTAKTNAETLVFLEEFWKQLQMHVCKLSPTEHDRVLARISHLPHMLAVALVNCSDAKEILMCGKGFLDTTRIASGPESIWRDIVTSNPANIDQAITRLIKELSRIQKALKQNDDKAILEILAQAREKRNELVAKKLQRKELPA
jgi:prephenate dehydrogenase